MTFLVLQNMKEHILNNVGNQTVLDLYYIFVHALKVNGKQTVWLPAFFKISSFVFCRRKNIIQVCADIRGGDNDIFILGGLSLY